MGEWFGTRDKAISEALRLALSHEDDRTLPMRFPYGQRYDEASGRLDSPQRKDIGFRGPVSNGDHIVSEYSSAHDGVQYPSVYRGIGDADLAAVLSAERMHQQPPVEVDRRAFEAAQQRLHEGHSPFYEPGHDPYPAWSPDQQWERPAVMPEPDERLMYGVGGSVLRKALGKLFAEGSGYVAHGKPSVVDLPNIGRVEARPIPEVERAISAYQRGAGLPEGGSQDFRAFNPAFAAKVAKAFDEMKHNPNDPAVRRAYEALIDDTMAQYRAAKDTGIDFHFLKPGEADPYAASPALGYEDIVNNGRLVMFPTDQGFGSLNSIANNPLLRRVGRVGDKDDAVVNDAFRIVHDLYGHHGPGNPFFRAPGEERAFQLHSKMFSPEALPAATAETRGQNSWVNYGPHGEFNRAASGADTVYADQKVGTLPDWASAPPPAADEDVDAYVRSLIGKADGGAVRHGYATDGFVNPEESIATATRLADEQAMSHPVGMSGSVEFAPVEITEPLTGYKAHLGSLPKESAAIVNPALQGASEIAPYFTPAAPVAAARDVAVGLRDRDPMTTALAATGAPGRAVKAGLVGLSALMPGDAEGAPADRAINWARRLTGRGFYSPAAEAIAGVRQEKGRLGDFLNAIKGRPGVTAEELRHSGIEDAFAPDASITRDEIVDYLHGKLPQIEERIYGGAPITHKPREVDLDFDDEDMPGWQSALYELGPRGRAYQIREAGRHGDPEYYLYGPNGDDLGDHSSLDAAVQAAHDAMAGRDPAKFQEYALPGGERYRELVMHLPPAGAGSNRGFESNHWTEPNVLAHLRMSDRTQGLAGEQALDILRRTAEANGVAPDQLHTLASGAPSAAVAKGLITAEEAASIARHKGWRSSEYFDKPGLDKKVLHLDEIQSDWGQKGRDYGILDPAAKKEVYDRASALRAEREALLEEKNSLRNHLPPEGTMDDVRDRLFAIHGRLNEIGQQFLDDINPKLQIHDNAVPAGPYVTDTNSWTDLALKRALREAAEGGYDKMVWTPGAEHAERYNLSKHLSGVRVINQGDGKYRLWGLGPNEEVLVNKPNLTEKELESHIGKELAAKTLPNVPNKNDGHTLLGLDLQSGGEGMQAYYDKLVPSRLQKLIKKLDPEAKMELFAHDLPTERGAAIKGHALHLTPKMREAIMKGLPAFKQGGAVRRGYATDGFVGDVSFLPEDELPPPPALPQMARHPADEEIGDAMRLSRESVPPPPEPSMFDPLLDMVARGVTEPILPTERMVTKMRDFPEMARRLPDFAYDLGKGAYDSLKSAVTTAHKAAPTWMGGEGSFDPENPEDFAGAQDIAGWAFTGPAAAVRPAGSFASGLSRVAPNAADATEDALRLAKQPMEKLAPTFEKENVPGVVASPRPGKLGGEPIVPEPGTEFLIPPEEERPEWSFSLPNLTGMTKPPPVQAPVYQEPSMEGLVESVAPMFKNPRFLDLLEEVTGLPRAGFKVTPTTGTWKGTREPSFYFDHPEMTPEAAVKLSKLLGFGMQQDAAVAMMHNADAAAGAPTRLIGTGKRLNDAQISAISEAAAREGVDFTVTKDGKAAKFLYFGPDEGYPQFLDQVDRIAGASGMKESYLAKSQSSLVPARDYLSDLLQPGGEMGVDGEIGAGARGANSAAGSPDLFGRIVDHLLAPYAKAVAGEGYRLSPERLAEAYGLSPEQAERVRAAMYPGKKGDRTTVPLMTGEEQLNVRPTGARGQASVSDVLFALQNRAAKHGQIDPGDYSPTAMKRIAEDIAKEVAHHVANSDKSAIGWYDAALKKAKAIYHKAFPELETNRDANLVFEALLGITSQGNDVFANSVYAARLYSLMRGPDAMTLPQATRKLAGSFGNKTVQIEQNLDKFNHLVETNGMDAMRDLFNQTKTVAEWNKILRQSNSLRGPKGELLKMQGGADQLVTGWSVFGPKIGSFINNLHGDYSTLTADLWFTRTWNRLLGHNFIHAPAAEQKQYQEFKDALRAEFEHHHGFPWEQSPFKTDRGQFTKKRWEHGRDTLDMSRADFEKTIEDPEKMLALAKDIEEKYRTGQYKVKSDLRRRAKNWIENRELPGALPRGDLERDFQQSTVEEAQKLLRKKFGLDISVADIQAALWFHEKELFNKLGVASERAQPADYADAAAKTVDLINSGELFTVKSKEPKKPKAPKTPKTTKPPQEFSVGGYVDDVVANALRLTGLR